MASESSHNAINPATATGMNLQTAFQQIAQDALSQIPVINMDSADEDSSSDVEMPLPTTAVSHVSVAETSDVQFETVPEANNSNHIVPSSASGGSGFMLHIGSGELVQDGSEEGEIRCQPTSLSIVGTCATSSSGGEERSQTTHDAHRTNFSHEEGFVENAEAGDDSLEERTTREELIEVLLDLRDVLRATRIAGQDQQQSVAKAGVAKDARMESNTSTMTELSLGPVEHIDLDALIAQLAEGELFVENDCRASQTTTANDTSHGYSEEAVLQRLQALNEERSAMAEKAPQIAPRREVSEGHRVRTVTWANNGEGRRAVALSEAMATQTSTVCEVSLSTDTLPGMQSVGTSTSLQGTSWHDIASPSTTMTNGNAYLASSGGADSSRCPLADDDNRQHHHRQAAEPASTVSVSAAARRLASLWSNQDSVSSNSSSDSSADDKDQDKDKSITAHRKHQQSKQRVAESLDQGSCQGQSYETHSSSAHSTLDNSSANTRQRWQRNVQPLSAAGGRKHPRISEMKKTKNSSKLDSQPKGHPAASTLPTNVKMNTRPQPAELRSGVVSIDVVHGSHGTGVVNDKTAERVKVSIEGNNCEGKDKPLADDQSSVLTKTTLGKDRAAMSKSRNRQVSRKLSAQQERDRRQSLRRQLMSIWSGMEEFHLPDTSPLFDEDITFETPAIRSLPLNPPEDLLSLTIDLMTTAPTQNSKTLSISSREYTTLLCWLLLHTSSVPESAMTAVSCPFRALSLQQEMTSDSSAESSHKKAHLQLRLVVSSKASVAELDAFFSSCTLQDVEAALLGTSTEPSSSSMPRTQHHADDWSGWSLRLSQIITLSQLTEELENAQHSCNIFWYVPQDIHLGGRSASLTEVTVSSLSSFWLCRPQVLLSVFYAAFSSGLLISGLRLAYIDADSPHGHLLIALRGPNALTRWQEAVGPVDVKLAQKTDPQSLHALYGDDTNRQNAIAYPRNHSRAREQLVRWFGPRLCTTSGTQLKLNGSLMSSKHLLSAGKQQSVLVVVSSHLPVYILPIVLARCHWYGYHLSSLRRRTIGHEEESMLRLPPELTFSVTQPSCCCRLTSESGLLKMPFLQQHLLHELQSVCDSLSPLHLHNGLFISHFPDNAQKVLLGPPLRTTTLPEMRKVHYNPELEQIVTLMLTESAMASSGELLCSLLLSESERKKCVFGHAYVGASQLCKDGPLELLGIRFLQSLPASVREFVLKATQCPNEAVTGSMLIVVVRGVDAFNRCHQCFGISSGQARQLSKYAHSHNILLPATPAFSLQLACMFFDLGHALVADHHRHANNHLLPPEQASMQQHFGKRSVAPILRAWIDGPHLIVTIAVIKPHLTPAKWCRLLRMLFQSDFTLVGARLATLTHSDTAILEEDTPDKKAARLCEGEPCLCLALLRENAIAKLIELAGPCDPAIARQVNPQSLRALFGQNTINNALHVSLSYRAAVAEVKHFFPDGLCVKPTVPDLLNEKIPCPAEDSIISFDRPLWPSLRETPSSAAFLRETNCILITPPLQTTDLSSEMAKTWQSYSQLLGGLFAARFLPVALRLVWFTPDQLDHCLKLLSNAEVDVHKLLSCGPVLVLALERDNAVTCFRTYLGSPTDSRSLYCRFSKWIAAPRTVDQANCLLSYFFEEPSTLASARL